MSTNPQRDSKYTVRQPVAAALLVYHILLAWLERNVIDSIYASVQSLYTWQSICLFKDVFENTQIE